MDVNQGDLRSEQLRYGKCLECGVGNSGFIGSELEQDAKVLRCVSIIINYQHSRRGSQFANPGCRKKMSLHALQCEGGGARRK